MARELVVDHSILPHIAEAIRQGTWCVCILISLPTHSFFDPPVCIGTFKFTYDGQRVGKEDTPAGVRCFVLPPITPFLTAYAARDGGRRSDRRIPGTGRN